MILETSSFAERIPQSLRLPATFAVAYMIIIFLFAIFYCIAGLEMTDRFGETRGANIFDCIYFSVVTVTTLGYGDISPSGFIQKFLVVLETLLGVFAFGLFLTVTGYELSNRQSRIEKEIGENRRELYLAGFYRKISEHISGFLNGYNQVQQRMEEIELYLFRDMHALEVKKFVFEESFFTRQTKGLVLNNPGMSPNTMANVFFDSTEGLKTKIIEELDRYRASIDDVGEIRRTEELTDYLKRIRYSINYGGVESANPSVALENEKHWNSLVTGMSAAFNDLIKTRDRYLNHASKMTVGDDDLGENEKIEVQRNHFILWLREYLKI